MVTKVVVHWTFEKCCWGEGKLRLGFSNFDTDEEADFYDL